MSLPVRMPVHCRPAAFELFAAHVPQIETDRGLIAAAVAIAMHEMRDASLEAVEHRLDELAQRIRGSVRSRDHRAILAHAHDVLFEQEGFAGNEEDYYDPANSYLPAVLESRRGIPISLSLVYCAVVQRLGLRAFGINAPLHFLAGVEVDNRRMLFDPYAGGRLMSREEALKRLAQLAGRPLPDDHDMLPIATHRKWIARMLTNLINIFSATNRKRDLAAMFELRALLENGA